MAFSALGSLYRGIFFVDGRENMSIYLKNSTKTHLGKDIFSDFKVEINDPIKDLMVNQIAKVEAQLCNSSCRS